MLEHALTRRVRQATPRDTTNPYYSAGSAYFDDFFPSSSIFPRSSRGDSRLRLPPAGGTPAVSWEEVERKDDVVSVLLPVTVRSPRRVKVLLNAFAQEFALALARSRSGVLDEDVKDRVEEVAKLVCLQVEFPLFAADLPIDPDLPSLVLACADALARSESPKEARAMRGVSVAVRQRAIGYAKGRLPTDESIDSTDENKAMTQAQGNDLLDYLRQTRLVAGPGSDLVRLEGLGISAGLDEALAIELNDLALKNRPDEVRRKLEELGEERSAYGRSSGCAIWSANRGASIEDNALLSLLVSSSTVSLSLLPVSVDLLAAIFRYDTEHGLPDEGLSGALDLAIRGRRLSMQRSLLGRPEALREPLRGHAIARADLLLPPRRQARRASARRDHRIARGGGQEAQRVRSDVRAALIAEAAGAATAELEQIDAELGADDFDEARLDELRVQAENLTEGLAPVAEALVEAGQDEEAEALLTPLLGFLHSGPTERIEKALEGFEKGTTRQFNAALAIWLSHRPTATFVRLGSRLNPETLGDGAAPQLGELVARLWREGIEGESEEASGALLSVGDLHREGASIELARLTEEIVGSFSTGIQAQQGIDRMRGRIALLEKVRGLDLIASEAAAGIILGFTEKTLASKPARDRRPPSPPFCGSALSNTQTTRPKSAWRPARTRSPTPRGSPRTRRTSRSFACGWRAVPRRANRNRPTPPRR